MYKVRLWFAWSGAKERKTLQRHRVYRAHHDTDWQLQSERELDTSIENNA